MVKTLDRNVIGNSSVIVVYKWVTILTPLILIYPTLIACNFLGEGMSAGSSEFAPKFILRFSPYRPVAEEDMWISNILTVVSKAVVCLWIISLMNIPVGFSFWIKGLIRRRRQDK